jgi:hypothetical protein
VSDLLITLSDGTKVTLDEFVTWSNAKQQNRLMSKEKRTSINNKISKANGRKVFTPIGIFPSLSNAATVLGLKRDDLSRLIYDISTPEFRYLERKDKDELHEFDGSLNRKPKKITYTPIGEFSSNREAIKALSIKAHVFYKYLISNPSEYYVKMTDGSPVPSKSRPLKVPRAKKPKVIREKKIRIYRSVITPKGEFPTIISASKAHNISKERMLRLIYNLDKSDYKFSKEIDKDKKKYFSSNDNKVDRKVITPKGEFRTVKEAAKFHKISEATLKKRIYDITIKDYIFTKEFERDKLRYFNGEVKKKKKVQTQIRAVITPKGRFESLSVASEAYGLGVDVLRRYVFNKAYPEFKYEKEEPRDIEKYFYKVLPKAFQKQTVFVRTPKGDFDTIQLAANAYGIEWHQMNRKIGSKSHPDFYKLESDELKKPLINTKKKKKTVTPLGTFNSKIEAIKFHKISRDMFSKLMRNKPNEYYFLEESNS